MCTNVSALHGGRLQAGILKSVTKHAFVLASKLGRNEYNCFPDSPGCNTAQGVLSALQALTLDTTAGAAELRMSLVQLHAQLQK